MRRVSILPALAVSALMLIACSDDPAGPARGVTVTPASADVMVGGTLALSASVSEQTDPTVSWAADCGRLEASGTTASFTAPWRPRSCTVTATSLADPSLMGTVVITVTPVPSSSNLLGTGGFDTDLSPFTTYPDSPPRAEWAPEDARGSPTSGSAMMHHPQAGNNGTLIALDYCFTPEAGAEYRAGGAARLSAPESNVAVIMSARVFSTGCTSYVGYLNHGVLALNDETTWTSDAFTFTATSNDPIRITLGINKGTGITTDLSAFVDDLFLVKVR